jgi:hypothetical protein
MTDTQLRALAAGGEINGKDLVWREPLKDWTPASKVVGLTFSPATPSELTRASPSLARGEYSWFRFLLIADIVAVVLSLILVTIGVALANAFAQRQGIRLPESGTIEIAALLLGSESPYSYFPRKSRRGMACSRTSDRRAGFTPLSQRLASAQEA